jgi:hypothetical protein
MEQIKYYNVTAKCGHVGRENYIPISFPVKANSAKEASKRVRDFPRVKHDHKDAIISCVEINEEEYNSLLELNNNDAYLTCKSKREQKQNCNLINRLVSDPNYISFNKKRDEVKLQKISFKLKKFKEQSKYNWYEEMIDDQYIYA